VRSFGDGFTALALPAYLAGLGFSPLQVGIVTTLTIIGSSILTLIVGLAAHRARTRSLLIASCGLMLATGLGFSWARTFWPLAVVGFVGTLNPSGGDLSVFLPLEQSLLAHASSGHGRTTLFARYGMVAFSMGALGALFIGGVDRAAKSRGVDAMDALRALFLLYGLLAVGAFGLYLRLPRGKVEGEQPRAPLGPSRRRVLKLAALFCVDSFGGGFLVQSMMALWLFQRFGLSLTVAGAFFFWTGLLSGFSQLAAGWLARRIGLINTMVFTHIPANLCVAAAAFAPSLWMVMALLLVRSALSQMDVPARTSYVMSIVTPAERVAASGVTNVPRSLASAVSPSIAGALIGMGGAVAWPLLIGGGLKIVYDLTLLAMFRTVRAPHEREAA
jgi:MFS family permease